MSVMKCVLGAALAAVLTACGGGGGSAAAVPSVNPITNPSSSVVADFVLLLDKNSINNSGTDKAKLTVISLDANRNIVPGAAVAVAVDQAGIFTPAGGVVTDANGSYVGNLQIGADKTDRVITLTVTVNGIIKRITVRVTGSKLSLSVPSSLSPNQSFQATATLLDSAGNAIYPGTITFSGGISGLPAGSQATNLSGVVKITLNAPATPGNYTISASGSGTIAADYQLSVFTSAVPNAVIPSGISPSLSASPSVLVVNGVGSTSSNSTLRFLFLDSATTPVRNVRVRFEDLTTGLALVGASISNTSTLYTDATGVASAQYIAGQNSSPTNGISVRACYSEADFLPPPNDCPANVLVNLTTSGQAVAVSIGDDNLLTKGAGTYIKNFAVTVADSAGKAVPNAPVSISVDLTHYGKGQYGYSYINASGVDVNALTVVPSVLVDAYPKKTVVDPLAIPLSYNWTIPSVSPQRIWCANEDTNRNGIVDPRENIDDSKDTNSQPTLNPKKSDLIVSYADPAVTTTNANGVLVIRVEYSQRFGTWLAYRVMANALVSGSQGMAERLFVTDVLKDDVLNGSFRTPPYGVGACNDPN